jgi:hypothetical protein
MIGGGGSGGYSHGGGGGSGAFYTSTVPVSAGTTLTITIGQGGALMTANGTSANQGGDTYIQNSGIDYNSLRVNGGGYGGGYGSGFAGFVGVSGGSGGGGGGQNNSVGATTAGSAAVTGGANPNQMGNNGGTGYSNGNGSFVFTGGGGGGVIASGGAATVPVGNVDLAGAGGNGIVVSTLNYLIGLGCGGGGAAYYGQGGLPNNGGSTLINGTSLFLGGGGGTYSAQQGGDGVFNTGSGGGGGSLAGGFGGRGASGRCIIKVITGVGDTSPISSLTYSTLIQTYVNSFQGYVSSYNNSSGSITIGNITNITGNFIDSVPYTINLGGSNGSGTVSGGLNGSVSGPVGWSLSCYQGTGDMVYISSSSDVARNSYQNGITNNSGAVAMSNGILPQSFYFCTSTVNVGAGLGQAWAPIATNVQVIIPTTGFYSITVKTFGYIGASNGRYATSMTWKASITSPVSTTTQLFDNYYNGAWYATQMAVYTGFLTAGNVIYPTVMNPSSLPTPYSINFTGFLIK